MEDKENNSYTYTQKIISQVVSNNDKETIKAITRYCEENNVYPNLISEEKLKEVIELGLKNERLQQENKELQQRFNSLLEAHKIQEELLDSKEYKLKKIEEYIYNHQLFGMRYGKTLYRESLINIVKTIKGDD